MKLNQKFSRSDITVLVLVFAVLLAIEILLRLTEKQLSGNIRHVRSIPELAESSLKDENKTNIFMLGNSLLNDGVDLPTLESELTGTNILKINPDGSSIWVWHYLYKNMIAQRQFNPDYIFIYFAWGQLSDNFSFDPSELGHFFCTVSDLSELRQIERFRFSDQSEFLVAQSSYIFANREAISKKILDIFVPDYRGTTQKINNVLRDLQSQSAANKQTDKEYFLLEKFLNNLIENQVKAVFIPMPVSEYYEIDSSLPDLIRSKEMYFLDCRAVPWISHEDFKDSIHFRKEASIRFSRFLSQKMKNELPFSFLN